MTGEICGDIYPGVQDADHPHTCGLLDGHEDLGEPFCDYHDCVMHDIGWTYATDIQDPGSGITPG